MTAFTSKWLTPSVSSVSGVSAHTEESTEASVSFVSAIPTHKVTNEADSASRVMTRGMPFESIVSVGNTKTDSEKPFAQEKSTDKTDKSQTPSERQTTEHEVRTAKTDRSDDAAKNLLIRLRGCGISVTIDGGDLRCRAAKGLLTPALADELKRHKPTVYGLVKAEDEEISWRIESIASELLAEPAELLPGICSYCGSKMPNEQTGKCVLCCLAAANLVIARLDAAGPTGHTTYPHLSVADKGDQSEIDFCDMSSTTKERA